jgi:Protein of unknown function (DUF3352)
MIKTRFALPVLAVLAVVAIAGCGGGSGSGSDLASFAAPGSLVFVEGEVRPEGALKSNVDSLAKSIAGVDNLGEFVVEELEKSARGDGEPFDFEKEVEPWLGEKAGVAFKTIKDGNLTEPLVAVETTDPEATEEFVATQTRKSDTPYKDGSYEGIAFEVGGSEGNAIGVDGEFLLIAEGEAAFKAAVDASNGESLADQSRFSDAISAASDGSLANAYVDVGGLIDRSGGQIDPQAREILQNAGIDPSEATAVASVIPGSDQIEVDLSSDLGGEEAPSGDASGLLASMPSNSFAALAVSGFGDQLKEALDNLDASGIPGQVEPHQLKQSLEQVGIDVDKIASSLEDAAAFAEGTSEANLGGALVLTTSSEETVEAIGRLGKLVRSAGAPGVTTIGGKASGFSVRNPELGHYPLVVAAKDKRIAIGYGLAQTLRGLEAGGGATLGDSASYKAGVSALGDTPISAFVDGPAALHLAEALVPRSETGFWEATRYLKKISYIALGTGTEGELATAKLIAGIEK